MDPYLENFQNAVADCDSTELFLILESATKWLKTRLPEDLEALYANWYKAPNAKKLMQAYYPSKHIRVYKEILDVDNIKEGTTHHLGYENAIPWYTDKNYATELAERSVLSGSVEKGAVGTHLIPTKDIIFSFEMVQSLGDYGVEFGSGAFGSALKGLANQDWTCNGNIVIAEGSNNRCQVDTVFCIASDKDQMSNDIIEKLKTQLDVK